MDLEVEVKDGFKLEDWGTHQYSGQMRLISVWLFG